jgi:ATP-grasp domain
MRKFATMIIDKLDGLNLLDRYDIRVVRAKYVDSPEDAIAFAVRRTAQDERAIPIVLCAVSPDGAVPEAEGPLSGHDPIRAAFLALGPAVEASGGRILARAWIEPGTDIRIEGRTDAALGKCLTLSSRVHSVERMVPIDTQGAQALAEHFQGYHHRGDSEKSRRMLEHLLMRVSQLFSDEPGVESFTLSPLRIHENSYTVLDAIVTLSGPIHSRKRLDAHAHDRKGHYQPSGRQ